MSGRPEKRRREKARRHEAAAGRKTIETLEAAREDGHMTSREGDIPGWVYEELEKAERDTPPGQLPVACITPDDAKDHRDILIVARASTFLRYFSRPDSLEGRR